MTKHPAAAVRFAAETSPDGAFVRRSNRFTDRVTADGSSGFPVQPGGYHLVVCLACPWAHRSVIDRQSRTGASTWPDGRIRCARR